LLLGGRRIPGWYVPRKKFAGLMIGIGADEYDDLRVTEYYIVRSVNPVWRVWGEGNLFPPAFDSSAALCFGCLRNDCDGRFHNRAALKENAQNKAPQPLESAEPAEWR
jgi:hypothetical protein